MVISMIRLSATNYMSWKPRMEDILYAKDMYDPLENEGKKPDEFDEAKWKKINRKAIGLIRQWIGPEVFHHVAKETSAFEL